MRDSKALIILVAVFSGYREWGWSRFLDTMLTWADYYAWARGGSMADVPLRGDSMEMSPSGNREMAPGKAGGRVSPPAEDRPARDAIVRGIDEALEGKVTGRVIELPPKEDAEAAAGRKVYAALEGLPAERAWKLMLYLTERLLDAIKAAQARKAAGVQAQPQPQPGDQQRGGSGR